MSNYIPAARPLFIKSTIERFTFSTRNIIVRDVVMAELCFRCNTLIPQKYSMLDKSRSKYTVNQSGLIHNSLGEEIPQIKTKQGLFVELETPSLTKYRVDELVARMFVGNIEARTKVKHIDGDQSNCYFGNLKWVRSTFEHRMVRCVNTNEIFNNPSLAAEATGLQRKDVVQILDGHIMSKGGLVFCDRLERDIPAQWQMLHDIEVYPTKGYHVIHVNTGRVYKSSTDACSKTGITLYRLRKLLSGEEFDWKFNRFIPLFTNNITEGFIEQNVE